MTRAEWLIFQKLMIKRDLNSTYGKNPPVELKRAEKLYRELKEINAELRNELMITC